MVESKVWYLAAGQKKVGPMATSRVLERVAQGKVPAEARVWRDGMEAWLPIHEVEEFRTEKTIVPAAPAPERKASTKSGSGVTTSIARTPKRAVVTRSSRPAAPVDAPFVPPHRIERADLWRAFGLGLDRRRVGIVLATVLGAVALGGALAFAGHLASKLHALLALPFLLAAGLGASALSAVGLGALSYHSRRLVEGAAPPTVGEAFGFALRHGAALIVAPVALSVAWLVPLVGLIVLSVAVKVPYLGPIGTGALFGVHIALGFLTLYLLLTAGMASAFAPVAVGFEGGGVVATFRALLGLARRSTARVLLWSALPGAALVPFSGAVLVVTALGLALPLASVGLMAGQDLRIWIALDMAGDCPLPGLEVGLLPAAMWVGLTVAAGLAVIGSVGNALLSLLYAAGREGNDELPTRDAALAAQAARKNEEN